MKKVKTTKSHIVIKKRFWVRRYICPECGEFEVVHSSEEAINKKCSFCGNKVKLRG